MKLNSHSKYFFQLFITIMDKLRLEIRAMDELHQDMRDLADTMSRLSLLPSNFEGKEKVTQHFTDPSIISLLHSNMLINFRLQNGWKSSQKCRPQMSCQTFKQDN